MNRIKKVEDVYKKCTEDGLLRECEGVDVERVKTILENAETDLKAWKEITPMLEKKGNYNLIWSNRYEIIRQLVQGILLLEKIKSDNHQCIFAHICMKHEELAIDWETVETMRIVRNEVHYQGKRVDETSYKQYKAKFDVYTLVFLKMLKERLEKK